MEIERGPKVECGECNQVFIINENDFDGPEVSGSERNMGGETQYEWQYIGECENCNTPLEVNVEGWEYPEGVFNYEDSNAIGCKIIEKPILSMNFQDHNED